MSTDKIVQALGNRLNRRNVVVKAGLGTVSTVAALLGFPLRAAACCYNSYCCTLCQPDSGACYGCTCVWCWDCLWGNYYYNCCECHSEAGTCGTANCTSVYCSWAHQVGQLPTR